ncbi:hypothetical protein [Helicobacter sp. 23-1045]
MRDLRSKSWQSKDSPPLRRGLGGWVNSIRFCIFSYNSQNLPPFRHCEILRSRIVAIQKKIIRAKHPKLARFVV